MSVALEQVKQLIDTLTAEERVSVLDYLEPKTASSELPSVSVEGRGGLDDPAWLRFREAGRKVAALPRNGISATQLVSDMRR